MSTGIRILAALSTLAFATPAAADERWLVSAGGGLTRAVSDPQLQLFGVGATGTAGFYRSLVPWVALGTRFTASVISNSLQSPEDPSIAKPEAGGLYTLTLSARLRPFASSDVEARATGLWLEGGGGVARTGALWRPALEAGLGYGFAAGPIVLSPTLRFQQVVHSGDALDDTDGRFASAGLEITFLDGSDEPYDPGPVFIGMTPYDADHDRIADVNDQCPYRPEDYDDFRDGDGCPDDDVDKDGIADKADACPDEPETMNGVNDYDGCPDSGQLEVVNGIIVIDERILFEFDSYLIQPEGLAKLRDLARRAKDHESWVGLTVEGHADVRGTVPYNQTLSELRAKAVRKALMRFGIHVPIEAVGYGEERPIAPLEHSRNRRVEIRVEEEQRRVTAGNGGRPMSMLETEESL